MNTIIPPIVFNQKTPLLSAIVSSSFCTKLALKGQLIKNTKKYVAATTMVTLPIPSCEMYWATNSQNTICRIAFKMVVVILHFELKTYWENRDFSKTIS